MAPPKKKVAKKKAAKKTQVAEKPSTEVAVGDWGDGETGFEGTDRSELAIPFINLLQANSALVESEDAKAGQFFNNVMETIVDTFTIIPCIRVKAHVEWIPVDEGGGLVAVHEPGSEFVLEALAAAKDPLNVTCADGAHELVDTIYLYCLVLTAEGPQRAVLSFTSSKMKKYRQFFTRASSQMMAGANGRKIQLPLWAHQYQVTAIKDENRKGKKFFNVNLEFKDGSAQAARMAPTDPLVIEAKEFYDMVQGGSAKADQATSMDRGTSSGSGDGAGAPSSSNSANII